MDEEKRADFVSRANEVIEEQDIGDALQSGEEDEVRIAFGDIEEIDGLKRVMEFLRQEEVVKELLGEDEREEIDFL